MCSGTASTRESALGLPKLKGGTGVAMQTPTALVARIMTAEVLHEVGLD
jgi:hypothetical protein